MAFAKGQTGNPGGRPKDAKQFRDALNMAIKELDGDKTKLRKIAEALVTKAVDGDVAAIREVADRLDGKPHQTAEVTHFRARASDLTDDELAGHIPGGSGEGASETESNPPLPN